MGGCINNKQNGETYLGSSFDRLAFTPLANKAGRGCDIIEAEYLNTSLDIGQLSMRICFSFTISISLGCL